MIDHIVGASERRGRMDIRIGVGRRRRWSVEAKGRVVDADRSADEEKLLGSPRSMRRGHRYWIPVVAELKTGYWAISRDDRPWAGSDPPAVVYTYAPGRGGVVRHRSVRLLRSIRATSESGARRRAVTLSYCWQHWPPYFFDIDKADPAPIVHEALERIAALYAIESRIRGRSVEERRAVRQAETKPLVETLKASLAAKLSAVSEKSTIANAIR